ncbi:ABC transporter ATP-binding protein [Brevibacterium casei]
MRAESSPIVLSTHDLSVHLDLDPGMVTAVHGLDLQVRRGEALGLVGESGSGKSLTMRALLNVLPDQGHRTGTVTMEARAADGRSVPARAALVFQEPLSALNPTMRVGDAIAEAARARGLSRRDSRTLAIDLLTQVGVPEPELRARDWPHELSGGLRQRVMIAVALATEPDVLFCDEPTTALDVTVQATILALLDRLRRERGLALVFVSHDLSVVAQICTRLAVMYAGEIVEQGDLAEVVARPAHPYTAALLEAAPALDRRQAELRPIPGTPPDPRAFPDGCRFAPRCRFADAECTTADVALRPVAVDRHTACIRPGAAQGVFS